MVKVNDSEQYIEKFGELLMHEQNLALALQPGRECACLQGMDFSFMVEGVFYMGLFP